MKPRNKHNRKALLAVPIVWVVLTGLQAAATADDAGQADAGTDSGDTDSGTGSSKSSICSVAGPHLFGTFLGAGCC